MLIGKFADLVDGIFRQRYRLNNSSFPSPINGKPTPTELEGMYLRNVSRQQSVIILLPATEEDQKSGQRRFLIADGDGRDQPSTNGTAYNGLQPVRPMASEPDAESELTIA